VDITAEDIDSSEEISGNAGPEAAEAIFAFYSPLRILLWRVRFVKSEFPAYPKLVHPHGHCGSFAFDR
jgi:hypothetical protein